MIPSLLTSELRRLRPLVLAAATLHLLVLGGLGYAGVLFRATPGLLVPAALVYGLAGLALGAHQVSRLRGDGTWSFWFQRPVEPPRLFGTFATALALGLGAALAAPLLLAALLATLRSPDLGTWPLAIGPYIWGASLACALAGQVLALRPWRGAALAVAPAVLPLVPASLGYGVFGLLALVLGALGLLAQAAFRADLGSPPRGRWAARLALAPALYLLHLALGFGLLFAYSVGVAFLERGWRGPATFTWNDYFPSGTRDSLGYRPATEALAEGLRTGDAEARALADRLAPSAAWLRAPERPLSFRRAAPWPSAEFAIQTPASQLTMQLDPSRLLLQTPNGSRELPLVDDPANRDAVLLVPEGEGWLVSLLTGARSERGFGEARQRIWRLDAGGATRLLVDRALTQGLPPWVRHRGTLLSPALETADDLLRSTLYGPGARTATARELLRHRPPTSILLGAALLALASTGAAIGLARRSGLGRSARRRWALAALLLGPAVPLALPWFVPRPH